MKKNLFLLYPLFLLLIVSCNKKDEVRYVDYPCSYIEFYVTDQNGNNLIDGDFEGNILGCNIVMEHGGKKYMRIDNNLEQELPTETKALAFNFRGLMTNHENKTLVIGYMSQAHDYEQTSFTIDWGNGSKDVITFDQKSVPYDPDDGDLYANCRFWVNGKAVSDFKPFEDGPHFTIVLNSRYGRNK